MRSTLVLVALVAVLFVHCCEASFGISSIHPQQGINTGGTVVTFTLIDMPSEQNPVYCHFGSATPVLASSTPDANKFTCVTPAGPDVTTTVWFSAKMGVNTTYNTVQWTFYRQPVLIPLWINWFPVNTTQTFYPDFNETIQFALSPDALCRFDVMGQTFTLPATYYGFYLRCPTPDVTALVAALSDATFTVSLNGQDWSTSITVQFYPPPVLSYTIPNYVPYGRSVPLTVKGRGFFMGKPGFSSVSFSFPGIGGVGLHINLIDSETFTLMTPAMSTGVVVNTAQIALTVDDGSSYYGPLDVPVQRDCEDYELGKSCDACLAPRLDSTQCGWCAQFGMCRNATAIDYCIGPQGTQRLITAASQCGLPPPPPGPPLGAIIGGAVAGGVLLLAGLGVIVYCCVLRRRQYTAVV